MLIEEYFQQIQTTISTCSVVVSFTLDCEKRDIYEGFIRAEIKFTDSSVLHIREFVSVETIINRDMYASLNLFYYPDLAVTCDDRDRISNEDFILHPKLIVEVLSDSTEAFDRGDKFADYKTISEFEEYALIHQKQILLERFQRQSDNLWIPQIYRTGDTIEFSSIDFSCPIEALYENIAQLL